MAKDELTILVKKSDGTFTRVPLSDLNKKPDSTPVEAPIKPVVESKISGEVPSRAAIKPVPTLNLKKNVEKMVVKEKPEDFKSLLEEDVINKSSAVKAVPARDEEVERVVRQLSFSVPQNFSNRFKNVIRLRIKDVRGVDDTKRMALLSIKDGGLGLTEQQADELESVCSHLTMNSGSNDVITLKNNITKTTTELPQTYSEPNVPATTTPFNSFVHSAEPLKHNPSEFKISISSKPQPVVRDVISQPVTLGPIEEIKYFRLVDFRRLANSPTEAVNRLKQKFINLKEESVLLFLDGVAAWRQSPLYQDYLDIIDKSFHQNKDIDSAALINKDGITGDEVKVLIMMEKELSI